MEQKRKITLPIKIVIIGCIIGLIVAGVGVFKQVDSKRINEERREAAQKQSQVAVDAANKRLKEIEEEYYPLKEQYEKKQQECDAMNMRDSDWFEKHSKCQRESSELKSKLSSLEMEDTVIKSKDYSVYYNLVKPMSYQIFYIIGGSVAGLAILGAFIIYLVKGKKSY